MITTPHLTSKLVARYSVTRHPAHIPIIVASDTLGLADALKSISGGTPLDDGNSSGTSLKRRMQVESCGTALLDTVIAALFATAQMGGGSEQASHTYRRNTYSTFTVAGVLGMFDL